MSSKIFISYAWTSDHHREWVHLLAAQLKSLGYNVLIDADVNYGDSLNSFMEQITESEKVLVIADKNYIRRANKIPNSGVGIENQWIKKVHPHKSREWLSVIYKDNPDFSLPTWLKEYNPKGFDFNTETSSNKFPGPTVIEDLWRWIEGLPANKDNYISPQKLRSRSNILEKISSERDRSRWSSPNLYGTVDFHYENSINKSYYLGFGEYSFTLQVSKCSKESIYVLSDYIEAVGINSEKTLEIRELHNQITTGRYVVAKPGDQIILLNKSGILCLVSINSIDSKEKSTDSPKVTFDYQILTES